MRLLTVFTVTLKEQLRSFWDLLIVIIIVPLFIWMYWSFVGGGSTSYGVLVINNDRGSSAAEAILRMTALSYESGDKLLAVRPIADEPAGEKLLRDRKAAAMLVFASDFSESIMAGRPVGSAQLTLVGDLNNPYFTPAAVFAGSAVDSYLAQVTGRSSPIITVERPLGGSATRTEFEVYVPGLIIAAGTMMLFSIAIALSRLIESGAVRRLTMTRMTSLDLLGGISIIYVIVSIMTTALSFGLAVLLGYRAQGSLWLGMLVCVITGISVIGVGLLTACFCPTVPRAAVLVNFPLLLLLFFSGAVFPIGNPILLKIGDRAFGIFDLLPQTHAVSALNKVLSLGAGAADISFELSALALLTVLYFSAGVILFRARHLRAA